MKIVVATLAALCAVSAWAQEPVTCPVKVEAFQTGPSVAMPGKFEIHYQNTSEKQLLGVKFALDIMDGVGDFTPYPVLLSAVDNTKPGKKSSILGSLLIGNSALRAGFRVRLFKVQFTDGSTWENTDAQCSLVQDYRKK